MQIGVETSRAVETKRIFVVDTDEISRAAVQFMLHDENETHEFGSLTEAFTTGASFRPDLLILGAGLLAAEGAAAVFAAFSGFPAVRLLIVADPNQPEVTQACLTAGAHGVIAKPLTLEAVRLRADLQLGRGGSRLPFVSLL